ncbi:MAG: DUF1289 domain-containing protein [Gammaproteobacteria bacterium]|nr:MAG: DUF1289 domain-containing protein [Gammaproteobacteria bacterium]
MGSGLPGSCVSMTDRVPSPCIHQCTLDDSNVCLGCHRTIDEIMAWSSLDNAARQAVLNATQVRKQCYLSRPVRDP